MDSIYFWPTFYMIIAHPDNLLCLPVNVQKKKFTNEYLQGVHFCPIIEAYMPGNIVNPFTRAQECIKIQVIPLKLVPIFSSIIK